MKLADMQRISGNASAGGYDGFHLAGRYFFNCQIPAPRWPADRCRISNGTLEDVAQHACWIHGAVLDNVLLDTLKAGGTDPLFTFGCVFRHVVLQGRISQIKFTRTLSSNDPAVDREWDLANRELYQDIDWALDISRAQFTSAPTFEAFPGSRIRRDPETQVLVRRAELLACDWQSLDYGTSALNIAISWFLEDSDFEDCVLVAASAGRKFKEEMSVLNRLRRAGLAH